MCIRDRNDTRLAWGHLTYTRPLTEQEAADYEPVSYTHLEVYKRQDRTEVEVDERRAA